MDIEESLDRILERQEDLGGVFYRIFLPQNPEAEPYFQGIDMERQAVLLTMALSVIVQNWRKPYPATEKYLRYLGSQHCRRSIPQEMYSSWMECMLDALGQCIGNEWHENLAEQWRSAMQQAADRMFEGYEQHHTV